MSSPSSRAPTFQFQANPLAQQQQQQQQPATAAGSLTSQGRGQLPPLTLGAPAPSNTSPRVQPHPHDGITSPMSGAASPSIGSSGGPPADSFTLGPYRATAPTTTTTTTTSTTSLLHASSRASSGSGQRSASPQPHMRKPTMARMSHTDRKPERDDSDKAPLLGSQPFEIEDSDSAAANAAAAPNKPSPTAPVSGVASVGVSTYYEQYEATVNRIRARRTAEASANADLLPTPERTLAEYRIVGGVMSLVLFVVALLIYFLYPRIPQWSIASVQISELRLWSDGTANFALVTTVGVENDNFVMTGIESINVRVMHNSSDIGATASEKLTSVKWPPRATSDMQLTHDLSPVPVDTFASVFSELSSTEGRLTLQYQADIVTSENFRLRNIQVACTAQLQVDPIPVPPTATIITQSCSHQEQTG